MGLDSQQFNSRSAEQNLDRPASTSEKGAQNLSVNCWSEMSLLKRLDKVDQDLTNLLGDLKVNDDSKLEKDLNALLHDLTGTPTSTDSQTSSGKQCPPSESGYDKPTSASKPSSSDKPTQPVKKPSDSKEPASNFATDKASKGTKYETTENTNPAPKTGTKDSNTVSATPPVDSSNVNNSGTKIDTGGTLSRENSTPSGDIKYNQSQPVNSIDASQLPVGNGNRASIPENLMRTAQSYGATISDNYQNTVSVDASNFSEIMSKPLAANTQYVFADGNYQMPRGGINVPSNVRLVAQDPGKVTLTNPANVNDTMINIGASSNNVDISGINFAAGNSNAIDVRGSNVKVENSLCTSANTFLQIENGAHNVTASNVKVDRITSYAVYADQKASGVLLDHFAASGSVQQWTVRSYANDTAVVSSTIQNEANLYGTNKGSLAGYGDSAGGNMLVLDSQINQIPKAGTPTSGELYDTTAARFGHLSDKGFPDISGKPFADQPVSEQISWFNRNKGNIHSWSEVQQGAPQLAKYLQTAQPGEVASLQEADASRSNVVVYGSKITGTIEGGSAGSDVSINYSTVDSTDSGSPFSAPGQGTSTYAQVFNKPGVLSIDNTLVTANAGNRLILNGGDNSITVGSGVSLNGHPVQSY